jgi:FkbM family methyltransferase
MFAYSSKYRMVHRCWRYRFKSEAPSIRFVRRANLAGSTLIDIGANKGIYSIYMSRAAGTNGRVIAFEPQPELKRHLQSVQDQFALANLRTEAIGLSSKAGSLMLRRRNAGSGGAGFHHEQDPGLEEISVPVTTLDAYADRRLRG